MLLVKRTIAIRLLPASCQSDALAALQATFARACNTAAALAFEQRTVNRVRLHHLAYYGIRKRFPELGAQLACNAMAAVSQILKAHRANGRDWKPVRFRRDASVHLDARTYRLDGDRVSVFTMSGRERIAIRVGAFQRSHMERGTVKEAELVVRRGRWYLHVALDLREVAPLRGCAVLGVDLGENVTAATSGGRLYGGGKLRETRDRFLALRRRLQGNGSQSARQLLTRVSGPELRHVRHVNHEISSAVVREAVELDCGTIAMENLTNIRGRIKAGKRMRTRLHRWAWRQLQQFVAYKAQAVGIAVIYVDPAYTSQTCASCGNLGKRSKHRFSCSVCGIFAHSDRNAACNLAKIGATAVAATGAVIRPHVAA